MGIDVARGLAVLGMFAAHVGAIGDDFWSGTGWLTVADGRSSAVFALLAGVSIALMSGGQHAVAGPARGQVRLRLAVRAVVVFFLGYALFALDTPIAVILPAYGVMFAAALPFLGARPGTLVVAAGGFALAGPVVVQAAGGRDWSMTPLGLAATGAYPVVVWMAYVLAGLAVGRLTLRTRETQVLLLTGGAGLALVAYGVGAFLSQAVPPPLAAYFSIAPHADTTPEVLGNLGVAMALVGLLLLLTEHRSVRFVLTPVAATGAMALTVYTAQIVAVAAMGPTVIYGQTTNGTLVAFTVVTLVGCTLWVRFLGKGPLERGLRALTRAAAPLPAAAGEVVR